MLKNILMLWHLGLDGALIDFMVKHFSEEEFPLLFRGEAFELQFKYNVFNEDEIDTFYNADKMKKVEEFVDGLISRSKEQNIRIISYYDNEYPANLKTIKKRPLIVYVKGNVGLLNSHKSIACVGTRKPSIYTVESVKDIVKGLVKKDTVIVSGLAIGVDTESHKVCLDNKGKTIAVLAHGLDTIYPKENQNIAELILENEGTLLSEYPIDTKIKKQNFIARNRIVSGLSNGVIIFEADKKSGTMHTARFAYKQNKKIFCPVHSKGTYKGLSTGVLELLKTNSAFGIMDAKEVVSILVNNKIQPSDYNSNNSQNVNEEKEGRNYSVPVSKEHFQKLNLIAEKQNLTIEEVVKNAIQNYINNCGG